MQTMRDQIVARIHRLGEGKAFSAKDFLDIGSRTTVDVTLASLTKEGKIRRKTEALADLPLLAQVVKHKETFYPSAWSRYDSAHPGSFHLVPVKDRMHAIERDYRNMGVMIFGEPPALDGIMETLNALAKEINKCGRAESMNNM